MIYAPLLFFLICFIIWAYKRLREWNIKKAMDMSLLRASLAGKSNIKICLPRVFI